LIETGFYAISIIMKEKHFEQNIASLREVFNQKKFGKFSFASLVYLIMKVFLSVVQQDKLSKIQNLAYKALQRSPWLGRSLIKSYGLYMFSKEFTIWLTRSDSYKSEHRIHIRVDRTSTGEHYGKTIPALKILYDHVKKYRKKTHTLEVLLISIGEKEFIVDFVLIQYKRKYKKKHKEKNKSQRAKTGYQLTIKMLKGVLQGLGVLKKDFIKVARLSMDGWYGKEQMFIDLCELGLSRTVIKSSGVGKVKYNGGICSLTELKSQLIKKSGYKDFNSKHSLGSCQYVEEKIEFVNGKLVVRAICVKYIGKKKLKNRFLLLLTPCSEDVWHAYQVVQCYKGRWGIEVMFRICKQVYKLEKYSYHSESCKNIELHFALCFIGYMWLNWYRVDCTRRSITSLKDVKLVWVEYLTSLRMKSLLKLFSGL